METTSQPHAPTILVILGTTGDLTQKKIIPALFNLLHKKELPKMMKIIGVSRRDWDTQAYQSFVRPMLETHTAKAQEKDIAPFLDLLLFTGGDFQNKELYSKLSADLKTIDDAWGVCSNKLFYLAVPPAQYETIFKNLSASHLTDPCSPEEGWTRVLVEKPFGTNLKTAEELDELLSSLFKEEQLYRIDHYLAKEMLQNILSFRFSNNLFEDSWSNEHIARIELRLLETLGVEKRGDFYDPVGALLDVGQNHLLQMLALVTMEHPLEFTAEAIREKRAAFLKTLTPLTKEEIKTNTFRAQYEGYRTIQGVSPQSDTETYYKIAGVLTDPRFAGVPFTMESGKRMKQALKEIVVHFKHPMPCLCPPGADHYENKVVFQWEPNEEIRVQFWAKKPGLGFEIEERDLVFSLRDAGERTQYVEEYEKLLLDCIIGDQTLFVRSDEVQAMWRFIDPIREAWNAGLVPLHTYPPDTILEPEGAEKIQ